MRKGWTKQNDTSLRREPNHGAEVLRLLPARTEVEVLDEQPRFTKVRLQNDFLDVTGYIFRDLLDLEPPEAPGSDPKDEYLLPCPRCASKNWSMFPLQQSGGHISQGFYIPTGFLTAASAGARVCLRCGYLELCVDQDSLTVLRRLAIERRA